MTKLSETQSLILTAGAQRPDNLALPLPKGLAGAAAKMAVGKMIDRGWLQEVEANLRRGEPLWRETGDGHGTTLIVTDAGLLAVGIEPAVVQTIAVIRERAKTEPEAETKAPTLRAGTKQAQLIAMLQRPEGATMDEITAALSWLPHTARGAMSGALGKKLGLVVTSTKDDTRGRIYRINSAV
ncbi:DUF3489 domain-containing protein [Tabrizicola oligotrophica]|uniref:DUF3489 domain-containing protein n=1 Tax=Tabrizicola oligotrophica TaxID=2710650 RepID=A0A6M0QW92_9RHOB|nr:DUF3489 domain-containing protein [Tabrizicola oligotrophica]NEY91758.1 DUF3489 domain-containing protein [Tabrizicola oligotrophica]